MATFKQSQYDILLEAIAQGALQVKYGDKEVTYRSLADMLKVKELMATDLGLNGTAPQNRGRRYAEHSKGI